jgi:hypothetical protein
MRRRDYIIPVINRNEQVEIGMLTSDATGNQPYLLVACNTAGIKINYAPPVPLLWGEPQVLSGYIGTVIVLLLLFPVVFFIESKALAVTIAGVSGILAVVFGVIALKIKRALSWFLK